MKKYWPIYYICFWLLVLGAFASMAQYTYGLLICGLGCLGFIGAFLHDITFRRPSSDCGPWVFRLGYVELISLVVLAFIAMLRNFSIDFPFAVPLQAFFLSVLLALFCYYAVRDISRRDRRINAMLSFYYLSVFVFILSLLAGIIMTVVSTILAVVAIVVAIVFLAMVAGFKNYRVNNDITSPGQYIVSLKNRSAVLFVAGLLVCGYNLLYAAGVLPPFYRGNTPERYGRLVEQAVTREDTGLASEFKIRYDNFVRRHAE